MKNVIRRSSTSRHRILRYPISIMVLIITIFLAIDLFFAWNFTSHLLHPACQEPQHLPMEIAPEEHWIATDDGLSLRIWYYPPRNGAVILSFGGLNGSLGIQIPQIDFLIHEGYGIIQVDSRACAIPKANVTLGGYELLDSEAALAFAMAQPEVNPGRIGTIGFSMGGATTIRLAARHPEIQAVVRYSGYADLREILATQDHASIQQQIFQMTIYWLFKYRTGIDPKTINPVQDLSLISPRPVLLIYGEAEAEPGMNQFQVPGQGKELWIVPDSAHGRNYTVAPQEYQQRVLYFFNLALVE